MDHKIKLFAIINPVSGTGKQEQIEQLLQEYLDFSRFQLQINYTEYAGHGSILARKAIKEQFDAVLAVGGDGTINEICCSLADSKLALGIIPCGSGNGLARHLGIPMPVKKAIEWLNQAQIRHMDTVRANGKLFVNVAGVGFDALISHRFATMESRGFTAYIKAVINSFFNYPQQTFSIQTKDQKQEYKGFLLSFANSSQFGNNAYIAPSASIFDGKINLILLQKPRWYQIPLLSIKTFTKQLESSALFTQITGDEFTITQSSKLGHVDGEPVEFGNTIHLKLKPKSLAVFTSPKNFA